MKSSIFFYDEWIFPKIILGKKTSRVVNLYCESIKELRIITDSKTLTYAEKKFKIDRIRQIFTDPSSSNENALISKLSEQFKHENLDFSLFFDIIEACEQDISSPKMKITEECVGYYRKSAAPLGRFIMAVADEDISTYYSAEILAILLKNISMLNTIKYNLSIHNRCYIPEDCLKQHNLNITDLCLSYTKDDVKNMLKEQVSRIAQLQSDAKALFKVVANFNIRWRIGVILSLTKSIINKYSRNDFLQNTQRLNFYNRIKAEIVGLFYAIFYKNSGKGKVI